MKTYTQSDSACEFLVTNERGQYRCRLYLTTTPEKKKAMDADMGMGAGCCSSLFNSEREAMLKKLSESSPHACD
jgi:hypothetical protein